MKNNLLICCSLLVLIFSTHTALSQQVIIDDNIPLQQLIENNFANSCIEVSNISSSVNGSIEGFNSFGYFQRGNSNFPIENGIVLSSGNAASGGNIVNNTNLSEGTLNWGTDLDIEAFLGVSNTVNATSIEFDFIALSNRIQFNYILASEEYFADYPCNSSDGFVFLIREASSTEPYQNIAVVPNTGIPVTINNIHDNITAECTAINNQYFDGYAFGDTNYNGRTTLLTASANVNPNVQYHVKLIVADQSNNAIDPTIDTAVFIQTYSFTELELGDDIETCARSITLNGNIQNPLASYTWYRNGTLLSNETDATLTTSLSGLYRVEVSVNGNSCVIQDEITLDIDSELPMAPIAPFEQCDNDGNTEEFFNLSTKNTDVENAVQDLPDNYSITYYLTDDDARNNPLSNINTINSTSRTIYVRLEDTDSGCIIYGNFELIVHSPIMVDQPPDLEVCDNDNTPNSITEIDLSEQTNTITKGNTDLTVTYHENPTHAEFGINPLPLLYTNTNPSEILYVRIVNTTTGCVNSTDITLTINVINGNTQINRSTQYIDACDADHDGFATFNLTQVLNNVLNGATGFLPPTYHDTFENAESGENPIQNPQSFANSNPEEQVIYLRLVDSITGCYAIIPIEIHTNLLLTATTLPSAFSFCDQDGDGNVEINLNDIETIIANTLPNINITFYASENDRNNNLSAIDPNVPFNITDSAPTRLYITIENDSCTEIAEISLLVNSVITFEPVNPISYCDTDDDGIAMVDFQTFNDIITGGNADFSVSYFTDFDLANNITNQLPQFYNTGSNTFYARIENNITRCYTINSFEINIIPAPSVMSISDIIICNNNTNTTANIRLEDKISEIVSDPTNLIIEFFEDITLAENFDSSNPSGNLDQINFDATTQTIYVRIEANNSTACYSIASFDVIVNTIPVIPVITSFQLCVDEGINTAGFFLQDKDAEILNNQPGKEVFYFQDEQFTTPLDKTEPYISNGQETIYVRVENSSDPTCFTTSSFNLEIGTNPNYNRNFTPFSGYCQDDNLERVFDFQSKREEISSGSTDVLDIKFYLTYNEANTNASTSLPDQYTSQELQGQFYARIENTSSCYVIDEVRFITFPKPIITSINAPTICDNDYDGSTSVNLNNINFQIENVRFGDVTRTFYEDASLTTQVAPNLEENYPITNAKTIFLKIETSAGCSSSMPIDLLVNLPPDLFTINTIQDCANTTGLYDLSQVDTSIIHSSNINNVNISYHNSAASAENNTGLYNNKIFNYNNAGSYPIYVRAEDINTGCAAFTSFFLQIYQNPIANTALDLIACDDDFDGSFEFDLSVNTNAIIGSQDASVLTVTYYSDATHAENATNALPNLHSAIDGEIIYARIQNNNTGCFAVSQFVTRINPLPIIPIDDVVPLCINDLPLIINADTGNPDDTYLWSTGETSTEIRLDGASDIGNYWVTVTTPHVVGQDCSFTKNFTVIESEDATINFTTKVDFADPNSITVNVSGIGDYVFILDDGEPQTSNVFDNVTFGLHIITIRDLNGCNDVTTEVVVIDIPKFVTPNNDGFFDTWHIVGIQEIPGTLVYIYNRHGKLLKTLPHTSIGWDGTFNGQNMPSDDYWFVAKVIQNGETFDVKGHFALKR